MSGTAATPAIIDVYKIVDAYNYACKKTQLLGQGIDKDMAKIIQEGLLSQIPNRNMH